MSRRTWHRVIRTEVNLGWTRTREADVKATYTVTTARARWSQMVQNIDLRFESSVPFNPDLFRMLDFLKLGDRVELQFYTPAVNVGRTIVSGAIVRGPGRKEEAVFDLQLRICVDPDEADPDLRVERVLRELRIGPAFPETFVELRQTRPRPKYDDEF
jgi:hypothetical protein